MGGAGGRTRLSSHPPSLHVSSTPMQALFEAIPITNHGIAHLATLQQLTRLSLAGRSGVTAQGLVWLSARTGLCHL